MHMRELTPEEEIVYRFAQGDADAGLQALRLYEPFLRNYRRIFMGCPNIHVWEMRRFATLFLRHLRARQIVYIKETKQIISEVMAWLYEATSHVDREDINAEIDACFLECCKRFDPDKGKFGMYLKLSFRYLFLEKLKSWLRYTTPKLPDPILVSYNDVSDLPEYAPEMELASALGSSWVWGLECSDAFLALTPLERWVLVERFVERRKVGDIAKQMGVRMGEVTKTVRRAVRKLEESALGMHMLKKEETRETGS